MKPTIALFAIALLLMACTADTAGDRQPAADSYQPIAFDTYIEQTRSLSVTDDASLHDSGFGVFAYYTGATAYAAATEPNFMFNQAVTWSGGQWTYAPLKYWPNDNQPADANEAQGSQAHSYLSFFAYAPQTGNGISLQTTNTTTGDPKVDYTASIYSDANPWGADLVWGIDGTTGLPHKNKTRVDDDGTKTDKVKFTFRHALVRLGLAVKADYDEGTDDTANRKILIESVTINTDALRLGGTLNLCNTTACQPLWESLGTAFSGSYDETNLKSDLIYTPLQPVGIPNSGDDPYGYTAAPRRVQSIDVQFANLPEGVLTTKKPLLAPIGGEDYVYTLVPDFAPASQDIEVTIVYHVVTLDADLPYGFSDQKNTCTATTQLGDFAAGRQYTLLLSLGLTSVKLKAAATDWNASTNITIP